MTTFSADVDEWVNASKVRIEQVFKTAAQELFYGVLKPVREGGRMRIDTGFLRSSFSAGVNAPVLGLSFNDSEGPISTDLGAIALVINQADIGDTIYFTSNANYARPREYGARGKPGDGFVMTNAARWQDYVNEAALKVRGSS